MKKSEKLKTKLDKMFGKKNYKLIKDPHKTGLQKNDFIIHPKELDMGEGVFVLESVDEKYLIDNEIWAKLDNFGCVLVRTNTFVEEVDEKDVMRDVYKNMLKNGSIPSLDGMYLGDGVYVRSDGSTYCED